MVPFAQPHTFTRAAAGSYVNGTYVPGASTSFTAMCSIQPLPVGQVDQSDFTEIRTGGRWQNGLLAIDSETELRPDRATAIGDRLTYQGNTFEIISANKWDHIAQIEHWECYAQRINGNTNA